MNSQNEIFTKTNKNSYIELSLKYRGDDNHDIEFHINTCDKIYRQIRGCNTKYIETVRNEGRLKVVYDVINYELVDDNLEDINDMFIRHYESNYDNDDLTITMKFKYQNQPAIHRAFNYDKYDCNNDKIEETDNDRKIRFTKFINMLRKCLDEWMEHLGK